MQPLGAPAPPVRVSPLASVALHVRSSADKAACELWHRASSAWEDNTLTDAGLVNSTRRAVAESQDPAFRADASQAVTAGSVNELASATRNAVNDCAADGVRAYVRYPQPPERAPRRNRPGATGSEQAMCMTPASYSMLINSP